MKQELMEQEEMVEFNIQDISPIVITLVIAGTVLVLGLGLMEDNQDDLTSDSAADNASDDAIAGVAKISAKLPQIAGVIVMVIIIGMLMRYFGR